MSQYSNVACIIVENYRLDRVNGFFEKHGYGPNNLTIPLININDSNDAIPVAWAAQTVVDNGILSLVGVATILDGFYYKKGKRGENLIDEFATSLGYKRKEI